MRPSTARAVRHFCLSVLLNRLERRTSVVAYLMILIAVCVLWVAPASGQQLATEPQVTSSQTGVPPLIRFTGSAQDINGNPLTGLVGISFAIYAEENGGSPLWLETQNVQADKNGHYNALLGATKSAGLPLELFSSGESRWLGVRTEEQAEQTRALLVAVPYALKASDAETVGGLPASAFVLANAAQSTSSTTKTGSTASTSSASAPNAGASKNSTPPTNPNITGKGVVDYIPMWDTASDIVDSVIFIGTAAPAATLDVNGKSDIRDTLTLFPKGTDSTLAVNGTTFKVDQTGKVTFIAGQTFPGTGTITGITTAAGSGLSGGGTTGTLSLNVRAAGITNAMLADSKITLNATSAGGLVVPGAMTLGSTYTIGLKTCAANQILEYSGTAWACATAGGTGTITDVVAGTDLTGGGTSGKVTLDLDTTKVPQLAAANSFTAAQSITGSNTTQLLNVTQSGAGAAILGSAPNGPGVAGGGFYGIFGSSTFAAGSAGAFQNTGGGKILSGLNNSGTQVFSVANNGSVTATSFSGNGSALTSLQGANVQGAVATATNATTLNGLPSSAFQPAGSYANLGGGNNFTGTQSVIGTVAANFVTGQTNIAGTSAVAGINGAASGTGTNGGYFYSSSTQGAGVVGVNTSGGSAGYFQGPVTVSSGSVAINGDIPMSHNPHMAFSGFISGFGSFGPCQNACAGFFIPDQNIVITRVTAAINNPGSNCSTPAVVQVQTVGTTEVFSDLNLPNGANRADSGPLSANASGGSEILIVGYSASGCTPITGTSPGNVFINVEYVMQ
jgi:hypothetical protein